MCSPAASLALIVAALSPGCATYTCSKPTVLVPLPPTDVHTLVKSTHALPRARLRGSRNRVASWATGGGLVFEPAHALVKSAPLEALLTAGSCEARGAK